MGWLGPESNFLLSSGTLKVGESLWKAALFRCDEEGVEEGGESTLPQGHSGSTAGFKTV